jgi:plasmid segregation protein ParM
MAEEVIIGVDTGNRCIKTANNVFVSGVKESDNEVALQDGVLTYNGKHYMLSQNRISYLQDKTQSEEYFILTLFAIAKELKTRNIDMSRVISVSLGVGLPPSHLPLYKHKFEKYFKRGIVSFVYDKKKIQIAIGRVVVFAQGYAAIYKDFADIKEFARSYIIDIGGYTTDVISLSYGKIEPDFCQSLDMGLIKLYNQITWEIQKKYGRAPNESQIDNAMEKGIEISERMPILAIINSEAEKYLNDILRHLNEYGIDLMFSKGIFTGGGAERLKKWIESSALLQSPYFILNVYANAQGYEAFLRTIQNRL